ncbi:MAG: acetate--CoA ligase family protein [Candidatus Woesearchaeota archaeon]
MQKILSEKEAEDFLEKNSFPIAKRKLAKTMNEVIKFSKEFGYPIALKISSKQVLHKTDVGGVKLNLQEKDIEDAYNELMKIKVKKQGILVQKYSEGKQIIIGLKKDPTFGHVLAFGLGGIFTEILKDVSFRICPITEQDTESMIQEIKSYPILKGYCDTPANIKLIKQVLFKTSELTKKYPKIKELDINPLIVTEKQATIVDARIIFDS